MDINSAVDCIDVGEWIKYGKTTDISPLPLTWTRPWLIVIRVAQRAAIQFTSHTPFENFAWWKEAANQEMKEVYTTIKIESCTLRNSADSSRLAIMELTKVQNAKLDFEGVYNHRSPPVLKNQT